MIATPDIFFVPSQFATVQAAVDAVERPSTIMIAPGHYDESVVIRDRSYLVLQSTGMSRRGVTVTGGEGLGVFVVDRSKVHLSGIEIRSNGRLRGVWMRDSTLSLQECVVAGNRTPTEATADGFGAGMECRHSTVHLQKSLVAGNTIDRGNGASTAALGGGLFLSHCRVEIAGCTIQANAAYSATRACGGGIWCEEGSMRMWRSRVTDNVLRAPICEGGGLFIKNAVDCQLGGSVITGNGSADARGGGIFIDGNPAPVSIHRNTEVRRNHPDDLYRSR